MSGTREIGWYPDPWGTDDERYFDGSAWTRSVRRPGGPNVPPLVDLPPVLDSPPAPSVAPAPPPAPSVEPGPPPPAAEPEAPAAPTAGWYADPWTDGALRYWDGRQWTGHVNTAPPAAPVPPVSSVRTGDVATAARWARLGLLWGGPALGLAMIGDAFQWKWMADHWDELTKPGATVDSSGNSGAAVLVQLAGIAFVVSLVLFLIWFHRAASTAAASGLPTRRSPGLATASFFIPVLNIWWPYQSAVDMLPADHPGRAAIRRWWMLWIAFWLGFWAEIAAAFQSVTLLAIVTGITVVLAMLSAMAARAVVSEITDAHASRLARA